MIMLNGHSVWRMILNNSKLFLKFNNIVYQVGKKQFIIYICKS